MQAWQPSTVNSVYTGDLSTWQKTSDLVDTTSFPSWVSTHKLNSVYELSIGKGNLEGISHLF